MIHPDTTHAERRSLNLDDLFRIQNVSDPQISPDGIWIAFVLETLDHGANARRGQITMVAADGLGNPRPLTRGEHRDSHPRWAPSDPGAAPRLAFISDRSGTAQIYLLPLDGGEPWRITDHPTGVKSLTWSPDGRQIAFLAAGADLVGDTIPVDEVDPRKRLTWVRHHRHKLDGVGFFGSARTHLWVIDLGSGVARQVTGGPDDDAAPAWAPDGRSIAFISDRSSARDRRYGGGALQVVDLASGAVRCLSPEEGNAANPSWSPDGGKIAYLGSWVADDASPAATHLFTVSVQSAEVQDWTAGRKRSVGQRPGGYLTPSAPIWSPDGARIFYLAGNLDPTEMANGGSTHLVCFGTNGVEVLTSGRRVVQTVSANARTDRFALLITDPMTPPEIFVWDTAGGLRAATRINQGLLEGIALSRPERLVVARPDGMSVEAWLTLPPFADRATPLPLIQVIHGGPHNYFGDTFSFDHQLFAASGYAVLTANPRGSGGYDEDFAFAVCQDWGGADFHDLMAVLDAVIARADPPIDSARLGITGGSYGGYLTTWAVGQTDRFAAAVAGACISNLISFFGTSDIGATWGQREFGGSPFERGEWYRARSPLMGAPRVQTPLLLYHGEADLRCPIEQSEQFFTALHHLGKTVEFLRVPEESHGVLSGSPAHQRAVRAAILEWFARYLGQKETNRA